MRVLVSVLYAAAIAAGLYYITEYLPFLGDPRRQAAVYLLTQQTPFGSGLLLGSVSLLLSVVLTGVCHRSAKGFLTGSILSYLGTLASLMATWLTLEGALSSFAVQLLLLAVVAAVALAMTQRSRDETATNTDAGVPVTTLAVSWARKHHRGADAAEITQQADWQ